MNTNMPPSGRNTFASQTGYAYMFRCNRRGGLSERKVCTIPRSWERSRRVFAEHLCQVLNYCLCPPCTAFFFGSRTTVPVVICALYARLVRYGAAVFPKSGRLQSWCELCQTSFYFFNRKKAVEVQVPLRHECFLDNSRIGQQRHLQLYPSVFPFL